MLSENTQKPIKSPKIPKRSCNILSYGAQGDGYFLNTQAIQAAIDDAHRNNGGTVVIPEGTFLTGSLVLKSGAELHLEAGAILLGSANRKDYAGLNRWLALILADGQEDIAITGQGTIDGQGRELALNIDALYHDGTMPDMNYNHRRHRPNEQERPQLIEFVNCQRVKISGVTIKNAACWVQTYSQCAHVTIENIGVESNAFWNNDGIDIEDCANVRISGCDINVADDGICLKSEHSDACCDNIVIKHCRVRSSASAVKFGTSSYGGFRNVTVRNISVYDTYRSAIALESVDGGTLENIEVSDIYARNTGNIIFIRLGHRNVDGAVGAARNIHIRRVRAEVPFDRPDAAYDLRGPGLSFFHNPIPASITGIPGHCVENVTLEDIEITYPGRANKGMAYIPLSRLSAVPENEAGYPEFTMFEELPAWGLYVRHVRSLTLTNISLHLNDDDFRPAYVFDDVRHLELNDLDFPRCFQEPQVALQGVQQAIMNIQRIGALQIGEQCSEVTINGERVDR
jgi:hypothetical protein